MPRLTLTFRFSGHYRTGAGKGDRMDKRKRVTQRRSEKGATAVEYALILSLLVLALIAGLDAVGSTTANNLSETANSYPS